MSVKLCTVCNTRRQYTGSHPSLDIAPRYSEMCNACYTEGSWENEHNDGDHGPDGDEPHDCWICFPELNLATRPVRKGHTNTVAHSHTSHDACYAANAHAKTPKGRAACRAAGGPKTA